MECNGFSMIEDSVAETVNKGVASRLMDAVVYGLFLQE